MANCACANPLSGIPTEFAIACIKALTSLYLFTNMNWPLVLYLLPLIAASPFNLENVVEFSELTDQQPFSTAPHTLQSYLDELYGELVTTSESEQHKLMLFAEGVKPPQKQEIFLNADEMVLLWLAMEKMKEHHKRQSRAAAHNGYLKYRLKVNLPADDDTSDLSETSLLGGIITFGHFDTFNCFDPKLYNKPIDVAIVGAPFDTGTSYRPGARFGPEAIRLGARRLGQGRTPVRGNGPHSKLGKVDPYDRKNHNLTIIDCGDVPMTPFDNRVALNQLYRGQRAIHNHTVSGKAELVSKTKIITMGGDHTVTLMSLRSAYEKFGQLAVLHFDSHIDTWDPKVLGGGISDYMSLNHGTFLHYAAEKGYLAKDHCFHVGLRAPYIVADYDIAHDHQCGFDTITARDLDRLGRYAIVERIKEKVGNLPVYISVDIDVLDPANAPGTGTMEIGGWTGRELLSVLDGLEGINLVGGDVVEVSPPYDTNSEITSLAATAVIDSMLGLIIVQDF